MQLRDWPVRVIPATPDETEAAIKALFARTAWTDPISADIVQELRKWFDAGWCVDAILVALDRKPDNSRQIPRGNRDHDLAKYLRKRLAAWFDDDDVASTSARMTPPRPGMSMSVWWQLHLRNQAANRHQRPQKLGRAGEHARQQARGIAASRRRDPVTRNREKDASLSAAMDRLLPAGVTAEDSAPLAELGVVSSHPRHRLEAGYAGRRAVVGDNDTIRAIQARLSQQHRRPTAAEIVILRNAMHGARVTASLAELEALGAGAGEVLSPEALRILRYYDRAVGDNLSLDSMFAVLTAMVEDET